MGKKLATDLRKVGGPPAGASWVWLTCELLSSPAWRGQSLHCRRLLDFLIEEHLAHNGSENGNLAAPYGQLERFGIGRRFISEAIREAEARRLIAVNRGGKRNQVADHLSRFRLTWLPAKGADQHGSYFVEAANDWKRTTKADIETFETERAIRRKRKQKSGALGVHSLGAPPVHSLGAPPVNVNGRKPPLSSVHHG
jgi:GNAT superfamily N-acetyltransferase